LSKTLHFTNALRGPTFHAPVVWPKNTLESTRSPSEARLGTVNGIAAEIMTDLDSLAKTAREHD
jgi:hypothetical protein